MEINKIYCGDCVEWTLKMEEASVDLIFFSPPYGDLREYQGGWTVNFLALGGQVNRVLKEGGICGVVIGDPVKGGVQTVESYKLVISWLSIGLNLFQDCVYMRMGVPGPWWRGRFRVDHEKILFFVKGKKPRIFRKERLFVPTVYSGKPYGFSTERQRDGRLRRVELGGNISETRCRGTVWGVPPSNTEVKSLRAHKKKHPATMPDALARAAIEAFTEEGDLVVDPMCGSGTTLAIAELLKRNWIGIDISQEYCELSFDRIHEIQRQLI